MKPPRSSRVHAASSLLLFVLVALACTQLGSCQLLQDEIVGEDLQFRPVTWNRLKRMMSHDEDIEGRRNTRKLNIVLFVYNTQMAKNRGKLGTLDRSHNNFKSMAFAIFNMPDLLRKQTAEGYVFVSIAYQPSMFTFLSERLSDSDLGRLNGYAWSHFAFGMLMSPREARGLLMDRVDDFKQHYLLVWMERHTRLQLIKVFEQNQNSVMFIGNTINIALLVVSLVALAVGVRLERRYLTYLPIFPTMLFTVGHIYNQFHSRRWRNLFYFLGVVPVAQGSHVQTDAETFLVFALYVLFAWGLGNYCLVVAKVNQERRVVPTTRQIIQQSIRNHSDPRVLRMYGYVFAFMASFFLLNKLYRMKTSY